MADPRCGWGLGIAREPPGRTGEPVRSGARRGAPDAPAATTHRRRAEDVMGTPGTPPMGAPAE
ncbi:hypothetical protein [Saccharothrix longispora]|uniref:hypothetical protein n=1 Tax=Saccharothrix longispora TaxID=33920 RepID=UPI0031E652AC